MKQFRLVILDYPKLTIDSQYTKNTLSDMIQAKQINYARTSSHYIPMGALDMISTHILIYDCSQIHEPKLALAIRTCYENRCKKYRLELPVESYIKSTPPHLQKEFDAFRREVKSVADSNATFVDPRYSFPKTTPPILEIGIFASVIHNLRLQYNHFLTATNERYKTGRWINPIGPYKKDLFFIHPGIPHKHKLLLIPKLSDEWLLRCIKNYSSFMSECEEVLPTTKQSGEALLSKDSVYSSIFARLNLKEKDIPHPPQPSTFSHVTPLHEYS